MENQAAAKTAPSQSLQDFQTTTQFFFESANYCFGQCVRDFSVKDLNKSERDCTNACVQKQIMVMGALMGNLHATTQAMNNNAF